MSGAQKRIAVAVLFAAGLISVALFMRADRPTTRPAQHGEATAVVAVAPERKAIPEQDLDNDGVPDWQDALQVTSPLELTGETTENYTAPNTLTEQFALDFFEDMVRAENYGEFGASPEELVASAATTLAEEAEDELLTVEDITILETNDTAALEAYGEAVARALITAPAASTESEITIVEKALRSQDPNDLAPLDEKIASYEHVLAETQKVPAPSTVAQYHLILLNGYKAVLEDIKGMRMAFDDPMLTLLRIKRYQDDALIMSNALITVYNRLLQQGATWSTDSAVRSIISIDE